MVNYDWPPRRRIDTCPPTYATTGSEMTGWTGQFQFASTGLINDAVCYRPPATPCAYCGLKAPADVYQCLGCGAPR